MLKCITCFIKLQEGPKQMLCWLVSYDTEECAHVIHCVLIHEILDSNSVFIHGFSSKLGLFNNNYVFNSMLI
jgi:hypothetical protein